MLRTRLNILNSPVNSICLQSTPSDWSPLIQYEAKLIAYGGVPPSLAWEYEIPAVIYADKVFVMRDFTHLPTKGVTPDVDTAGWLVFPSSGGTSNPPHTQAFAITTDNSTNTFTPASDTSSNIIFIDATGQFSLATIIIASSSFIGTLTIITRSGSINAVTIQFPNKNDYRTLAVNFTYTYSVTTPDIYTGASTNPRFCTAMSVAGNSIDKTVGGSVDGISTNAVGFFVLKNQVAPEVTDTPDGIYLSTGTLPLIMAVEFGNLPLGSSVYIISGSTNRGKTFSDWVNTQYNNDLNQTNFVIDVVADTTELNALPEANDSFAYIPDGNDKGIYAKINNAWQLTTPSIKTKTIAIPTLSNGSPQEITLTWDTPFTTNAYNAFVSYVSDENGLISITEKQGSKTQTGVDYLIQNSSQLLTLSNVAITVSGIG